MVRKFIKLFRLLFDMDSNDVDRNYSKYSPKYNSYKA